MRTAAVLTEARMTNGAHNPAHVITLVPLGSLHAGDSSHLAPPLKLTRRPKE